MSTLYKAKRIKNKTPSFLFENIYSHAYIYVHVHAHKHLYMSVVVFITKAFLTTNFICIACCQLDCCVITNLYVFMYTFVCLYGIEVLWPFKQILLLLEVGLYILVEHIHIYTHRIQFSADKSMYVCHNCMKEQQLFFFWVWGDTKNSKFTNF